MFTNLKNKIFEEVKASPQKFQQFAQAAQAAVSSASSNASDSVSGSDNFFSITEEDTPQNSPHKPASGATITNNNKNSSVQSSSASSIPPNIVLNNGPTRTRKLSNSSVASDVSFRLPSYDSPAVYHLQSDLDISASEVEDSASTVSARLDLISKEQLHDAYRKALDRYQKYRARYTDLAKKYRDLERDSTKARQVLVETQDKAIRRISELREQCTLEQQAKAHLEEALRIEMDDMQCKIKAYQEKLKLLEENPENIEKHNKNDENLIQLNSDENNLINLTAAESVNGQHNESDTKFRQMQPIKNRIQQLEEELLQRQTEIEALNQKLSESDKIIDNMRKREEENTLLLAQNKQAIHSELENKESEVKKLTASLSELDAKFQQTEKEKIQLKKQIVDISELYLKLKQLETIKQDLEAKRISSDHILGELKKELKEKETQLENAKKLAEENHRTIAEYDEKIAALTSQNEELNLMLQRSNKTEIELAQIDNELNITKTENINLRENIEDLRQEKEKLLTEIQECKKQLDKSDNLLKETQRHEEELLSIESDLKMELERLKKDFTIIKDTAENYEQKIKQLERELRILRDQNEKTDSETVAALKQSLQQTNADFTEQLKSLRDKLHEKENELDVTLEKCKKLEDALSQLESKKKQQEDSSNSEINNLKHKLEESERRIDNIIKEKQDNEQAMEKEKMELKLQVTNILQEIARMEEQMRDVKKSHAELEGEKRSLEKKIEKMTKQNQENLEGNSKWKVIAKEIEDKLKNVESENAKLAEKNCLLEEKSSRLENCLKDNENNFKKEKNALNSKIKESEENFILIRSENEAANENIKKLNEKMSQVLDENSRLMNAKEIMEHEFRSLQDQLDTKEKEKLCVIDSNKILEEELIGLRKENDNLKRESTNLEEISNNLRDDLNELNVKLNAEKGKREKIHTELKNVQEAKSILENTLKGLQEKLKLRNQEQIDGNRILQEENENLKQKNDELESTCEILTKELNDLKQQIVNDINKWEKSYEDKVATTEAEINALNEKLMKLSQDNNSLKEQNDSYKEAVETVKSQSQARITELEDSLKRSNEERQSIQNSLKNVTELENKLKNYEEIRVENEFLTTHTKQLELDLNNLKIEKTKLHQEFDEIKEKLKSQQCELYVLSENKEKHAEEIFAKDNKIETIQEDLQKIRDILDAERAEATRQMEHNSFITGQNDMIQKELLLVQTKLVEAEKLCGETRQSYEEIINENDRLKNEITNIQDSLHEQIDQLNKELENNRTVIKDLSKDLLDATKLLEKFRNVELENQQHQERIKELEVEINEKLTKKTEQTVEAAAAAAAATVKSVQSDSENLRNINEQLQRELEDLKYKSSAQISNLIQELEDTTANSKQLAEKITDYDRIKEDCNRLTEELNKFRLSGSTTNAPIENINSPELEVVRREKDELESKLNKIMHEVQDVSNRNLFLEQKCENYLILEQSNERLKLANAKLSRQLDETLVSLQHNENIQANTEFEYLRNIMFQYLTGTVNGNNDTLVKVIAAVLKFTPQQTQVALEKEHQRHSVLGQINNLL